MNKSSKLNSLYSLSYTVVVAIFAFWGAVTVGHMVESVVHPVM